MKEVRTSFAMSKQEHSDFSAFAATQKISLSQLTLNALRKFVYGEEQPTQQSNLELSPEQKLKQLKAQHEEEKILLTKQKTVYTYHNSRIANAKAFTQEEIAKKTGNYVEVFGAPPSKDALKAIKEGAKIISAENSSTGKAELTEPPKPINVLLHVESVKKNDIEQYVTICKYCRADFIDTDRTKTLAEFETHLRTWHKEECKL